MTASSGNFDQQLCYSAVASWRATASTRVWILCGWGCQGYGQEESPC